VGKRMALYTKNVKTIYFKIPEGEGRLKKTKRKQRK
jgi:hypothetical protein